MDHNITNKKQPLPYVLQIIISIQTRNIIEFPESWLPPVYRELFPSIITYKTFFSMSSAFTHSCFHFRYVSFVRSSLKILLALFAKPPETSGYVWFAVLLDVEGMPLPSDLFSVVMTHWCNWGETYSASAEMVWTCPTKASWGAGAYKDG